MPDGYEQLKKKYRHLKILAISLALLLLAMIYFSYDYLVFKILIAGNYIFTDTLDSVYAAALGEDNVKGYYRDFDRMVISVVTERLREVSGDRYTYLYTPSVYKNSKAAEKADAEQTTFRELDDESVYLRIPNISKGSRQYIMEHKQELERYKNITIDLRGNYGGMLNDYYNIARLFLGNNAIIGYEKTRIPIFTRQIRAGDKAFFSFETITILQDQNTASAAEGLIMALKKNLDNVELRGEKTFGKGIGQVTIPLTGGYAVKATVLLIATPDGDSIHGLGIEPD